LSRVVLGTTKPRIQREMGLSLGGKGGRDVMLNIHFNLVPTLGMSGNIPPLQLYTFMSRTGKSRGEVASDSNRACTRGDWRKWRKTVRLAKQWAEIWKGKHPRRKKIGNPHDSDV
jgi:hypothetical protein